MNVSGSGPTSHNFYSQRLRLQYVDYGNQDKPLLVLAGGGIYFALGHFDSE